MPWLYADDLLAQRFGFIISFQCRRFRHYYSESGKMCRGSVTERFSLMSYENRRVVVTGIGAVSPVGIGKDDMWKALLKGNSGVERIQQFDPDEIGLEVKIAAEVKNFDIADFFP